MTENYSYTVVRDEDKWRIVVTEENGESHFFRGICQTEAEAWSLVRYLQMDDDKIDVIHGATRKYQS